jgi:hypothetical protein
VYCEGHSGSERRVSGRFIIGFFSYCVAMAGCLLGNTAIRKMIEEVDRSRPKGQRFSEKMFLSLVTWEILAEYERQFPHGALRKRWRIGLALLFIGFAGVAACMFLRFR